MVTASKDTRKIEYPEEERQKFSECWIPHACFVSGNKNGMQLAVRTLTRICISCILTLQMEGVKNQQLHAGEEQNIWRQGPKFTAG